jgi:hypothetical protein
VTIAAVVPDTVRAASRRHRAPMQAEREIRSVSDDALAQGDRR